MNLNCNTDEVLSPHLISQLLTAANCGDVVYLEQCNQEVLIAIATSMVINNISKLITIAAASGHAEFIKTLYKLCYNNIKIIHKDDHQQYLYHRTYNHNTAMILAAENGHANCIQTLYECCPYCLCYDNHNNNDDEINYKNNTQYNNVANFNALMLATKNGHANCIQTLYECYGRNIIINKVDNSIFNRNAIMIAAINGHANCIQTLYECFDTQFDINQCDIVNLNALMLAAENGHANCIQMLYQCYGNTININALDQNNYNAIMLAAEIGQCECIRTLYYCYGNKINIHQLDRRFQHNAMMLAAKHGHMNSIKTLYECFYHRIDDNMINNIFTIAIDYCWIHTRIISQMIEYFGNEKFDCAITDKNNNNALGLVVMYNKSDIGDIETVLEVILNSREVECYDNSILNERNKEEISTSFKRRRCYSKYGE